jgi:hypothetical protein
VKDELLFGADEFLGLFKKGADLTRELLEDNENLRRELARLEDRQALAARSPEQWTKLRHELLGRIQRLEQENSSCRERLGGVEQETGGFARRYGEVEEENNNLANLYVASYQLHSTLDFDEVLSIITEIVINLIGAEVFSIYLLDESTGDLSAVTSEGIALEAFPRCPLGSGVIGESVLENRTFLRETARSEDLTQPIVCVPLAVQGRPLGAIAVFGLLQQKRAFSALDHELFGMLGGHAATALFAARLYSQSRRKLNTIQGFIDLLAK